MSRADTLYRQEKNTKQYCSSTETNAEALSALTVEQGTYAAGRANAAQIFGRLRSKIQRKSKSKPGQTLLKTISTEEKGTWKVFAWQPTSAGTLGAHNYARHYLGGLRLLALENRECGSLYGRSGGAIIFPWWVGHAGGLPCLEKAHAGTRRGMCSQEERGHRYRKTTWDNLSKNVIDTFPQN